MLLHAIRPETATWALNELARLRGLDEQHTAKIAELTQSLEHAHKMWNQWENVARELQQKAQS